MSAKVILAAIAMHLTLCLAVPLAAQDNVKVDYIVSWEPSPESYVTQYLVYRSTAPDTAGMTQIATVPVSAHTYVDSQLPKGTRYYYRVKAKNGSTGDVGAFSNPVSGYTIAQDANAATKALCNIIRMTKVANGSYDIAWSTTANSIGFVQYDRDYASLDSMSTWDDSQYGTSHTVPISNLVVPSSYYVRAVSYDNQNNMTVSCIDTLIVTMDLPQPISTRQLSIYPVPYHPRMGQLHFTDLPAGGSVTIYAGNGNEVWHRNIGTETSFDWDGSNQQGSSVTSGVYYAIIKDAKGSIVEKRPIMIVH